MDLTSESLTFPVLEGKVPFIPGVCVGLGGGAVPVISS